MAAVCGLVTSHAEKGNRRGNRRGNRSVSLGRFLNEINSLGRRFGSYQPPQKMRVKTRTFGSLFRFRGRRRAWQKAPAVMPVREGGLIGQPIACGSLLPRYRTAHPGRGGWPSVSLEPHPCVGATGAPSRTQAPQRGGAGHWSARVGQGRPVDNQVRASIQPPCDTTRRGPARASGSPVPAGHACTRWNMACRLSPSPGRCCRKSAHQASTSCRGTAVQGRPSQRPKSISANAASTRCCQPQRRSHRPTAAARSSCDVHTQRRRPHLRAVCRMRWASRLARRGSTGRSVWPMQRPVAPCGRGWRQTHRVLLPGSWGCTARGFIAPRQRQARPAELRLRSAAVRHPACPL